MDILACRPEENSYNILPSAATMLFHGLPGGDMHGVVEEMDRRAKSESVAISSAIDMGESETVNGVPPLLPLVTPSSARAAGVTFKGRRCIRASVALPVLFFSAFRSGKFRHKPVFLFVPSKWVK